MVRALSKPAAWSRWIVLPYLILADVQNTVLSAWLTFSAAPIYRHYTEVPRDRRLVATGRSAGWRAC